MDEQPAEFSSNQTDTMSQDQEQPHIKRSFTVNKDREINYDFKSSDGKKSGKGLLLVIIGVLLVAGLAGAYFFRHQMKSLVAGINPTPVPSPLTTPSPVPTPNPLVRSDWSLEILNGSGESGLAKKVAVKVQALGYQVVKTGNADKDNYTKTEILVKKDLLDKVDLVIADLKDTVRIASVAGQLQEGTASARIILGKDSI